MHTDRLTLAGLLRSAALLLFAALLASCARTPIDSGSRAADAPRDQALPPAAASAPAFPAEAPSLRAPALGSFDAVIGGVWQWAGLSTPVEELDVYATDRYTIRFLPTRRVELAADCNRGGGNWSISGDHDLAIGPIALTRMACPPGSLSERFAASVERVSRWLGEGDELFLELSGDQGVLRFRRPPSEKPLRESP